MDISILPPLNAALNAVATVLLLCGFWAIKTKRRNLHRNLMLTALACSVLFLISYIVYHSQAGVTRFTTPGWPKTLYFSILYTHTPLAVVNLVMVILTVRRAARSEFTKHKRIARFTLPIWLYVSITGVIIYFMLYQWFPPQ
ncbi:MAG TPA: DUF420 domain-containing protein [candidate division Zixibacteria bacterium]|jgi:uncharacterized membrane protein YozB (DUF420 family)